MPNNPGYNWKSIKLILALITTIQYFLRIPGGYQRSCSLGEAREPFEEHFHHSTDVCSTGNEQ